VHLLADEREERLLESGFQSMQGAELDAADEGRVPDEAGIGLVDDEAAAALGERQSGDCGGAEASLMGMREGEGGRGCAPLSPSCIRLPPLGRR